jgi:hypothetical protein
VIGKKLNSKVRANSSRMRCAIYSRDTKIRICSVPQLKRKYSSVKIPSWDKVMGLAEYFCRPLFGFWPNMPRNPAWAGKSMGAQA